MKKILRIKLNTLEWNWEELHSRYSKCGGHALTSMIICDEVPPKADPLGGDNKLVFSPGILAGTTVANCNRLSVGTKSPLTNGIKEANSGGTAGLLLARLGIAALVLEGQAPELTQVILDKNGVRFESAVDLKGLGNYALYKKLEGYAGIISIGQAGENLCLASSIAIATKDLTPRFAARGGVGAVMGSKKVKTILIDDSDLGSVEIPAEFKDEFRKIAVQFNKNLIAHPLVQGFRSLGTSLLLEIVNEVGGLPTKNYAMGRFNGAEKISAGQMVEFSKSRPGFKMQHRCMDGCLVSCSNVYTDKEGEEIVSGMEFETLALLGSNCMIDDLDAIAQLNRICNDVGVDTMDVGGAIAIAMEAGLLDWGDGTAAISLAKEMADGTERGRMVANGGQFTGERLGIKRIPAVKRQIMAGYDPRVLKGTGVAYATSPQGADHTTGCLLPAPGYDCMDKNIQSTLSQSLQRYNLAVDSLGLCLFPMLAVFNEPEQRAHIVKLASFMLRQPLGDNYLDETGKEILALEKRFNFEAGLTKEHDRLPDFFMNEEISTTSSVFDVSAQDLDLVIE